MPVGRIRRPEKAMPVEPPNLLPRLLLAGSLLCLAAGGALLLLARGVLPPLSLGQPNPADAAIYEYPRDSARNCDPAVFIASRDPATEVLTVRSGPGPDYRTRNALTHGDTFLVFEYRGDWAGIAYGHNREVCGALEKREVRATHRGWVHVSGISFLPGLPD